MGLYLCIFDGDKEIDGVEVGPYEDFAAFRYAVARHVERGEAGIKCPILMMHSKSEGEWSPTEAAMLQVELSLISDRFAKLPPEPLVGAWKSEVAKMSGLRPVSLYDCFFDVDGKPLLTRLIGLAQLSQELRLPILFQ